jgi:uncharacterized delta-60 repeat protein
MIRHIYLASILLCFAIKSFAEGGLPDTTFHSPFSTAGFSYVNTLLPLANGKVLLGGSFSNYAGTSTRYLVQLNSDGTHDSTFLGTLAGPNLEIKKIIARTDGKYMISGSFSKFNGNAGFKKLVRVYPDGTLDTTFKVPGTGFNYAVNTIAMQTDGKILVGGTFTDFNGTAISKLLRLNVDGTRDTTFSVGAAGFSGDVQSLCIQPDGKILVGGNFSAFNGSLIGCLVRLNSDGTPDATFNVGGSAANGGTVSSIALQSTGKILLSGSFTMFNGNSQAYLTRLNSNGTVDLTFNPGLQGPDNIIYCMAVDAYDNIFIGGTFSNYNTNFSCQSFASLLPNGAYITSFNLNNSYFTAAFGNPSINDVKLASDGRIYAGGKFITYYGVANCNVTRMMGSYVTVGVQDLLESSEMTVYPNPSNDLLSITLKGKDFTNNLQSQLSLFDDKGVMIMQKNLTQVTTELQVNQLSPGIYNLLIQNGQNRIAKKIVVQ